MLFCAAIGGIAGSIGTGLLANNIDRYQIVFLEGILFFLFGLVAVRKDSDLVFFLRAQATWVGLAVALIHFFTIATGFRFRNAIVEELGIYYGGVLGNPNALAAYYVMLIPVALSMLVRERLAPLMRSVTCGLAGRDVRLAGAHRGPQRPALHDRHVRSSRSSWSRMRIRAAASLAVADRPACSPTSASS